MEVCPECFDESKTLREYIESEGVDGDCPTCGTRGTKIIAATELSDLFEPLSHYYQAAQPGEHYIYDSEGDGATMGDEGESLDQLLQDEWPIFSDKVNPDDISRILKEVWPDYDATSNYARNNLWYVSPDEEFQSLAERLMYERRFFPKEQLSEPGRTSIERLLDHRLEDYSQGIGQDIWFRARRHEETSPHTIPKPMTKSEIGAPPREKILRGGRANPAGISYLYLGSSVETVVAEIRSLPSDYVSVGLFTISSDLMVIDLASKPPLFDPFNYENLKWEIERRSLLQEFALRLSQPVREEEHELGYVVTQYLAEFIASKGYAGIIYPSAMSKGVNLVLFDPEQANCTRVTQFRVEKIGLIYEIQQIDNSESKGA